MTTTLRNAWVTPKPTQARRTYVMTPQGRGYVWDGTPLWSRSGVIGLRCALMMVSLRGITASVRLVLRGRNHERTRTKSSRTNSTEYDGRL
jgi:hypothetical protein